jgi:glycosyltransferase involved in cell wall biosynthesis
VNKVPELAISGRFMNQATTGVQRVSQELTREIDNLLQMGESRIRVRFLCPVGTDLRKLGLKAITVEEVSGSRGWLWDQIAFPKAAGDAILLCLGNSAPVTSLIRGAPVALMIHDLSYRKFPHAYRLRYRAVHSLLLPLLLRYSRPLITVSNAERATLARIEPQAAKRIIVAQNGGWRDEAEGSPIVRPAGRRYALYVGSLSERKNFSGLLETAIRLVREDDIDFVIAGEVGNVLNPVDRDVPDDLSARIRFVGQVEDLGALRELYSNASCLVFPSFYEASPLPPIEAMRFGCPVIVSNTASLIERCGDAAEYCDPTDIGSILGAVRRVLHDPERSRELIERGRLWEKQYSWRRQARVVLDAIIEANATA